MNDQKLQPKEESKQSGTYLAAVFCLGMVLIIWMSFQVTLDVDAFWHLTNGQQILAQGLSPFTPLQDTTSFTFSGKSYYTTYYFDVAYATLVRLFGQLDGATALRIIFLSGFWLTLWRLFRNHAVAWQVAIGILLPMLYVLAHRLPERAELLHYWLAILCFLCYQRAIERFNHRSMLGIALVLLLWVNYHTPIIGYVIIFGLFVQKAMDKIQGNADFKWFFWLGWGIGLLLIGFINPQCEHFLSVLQFDPIWYESIREYRPAEEVLSSYPIFYMLYVVYAYLILWLLLHKQYGRAVIVLVMTYESWNISRLFTIAAVLNLTILAISITREHLSVNAKLIKKYIKYIYIAANMYFSYILIIYLLSFRAEYADPYSFYPVATVNYLKTKEAPIRVLNLFHLGGYLGYALNGHGKIYIDGRTNLLFPASFYRHYLELTTPDAIENEFEKYHIDYILFGNVPMFVNEMQKAGLVLDYEDKNGYLLLRRYQGNFPLIGQHFDHPECWGDPDTDAMDKEIQHGGILPDGSELKQMLNLLGETRRKPLQDIVFEEYFQDRYKRLYGAIMLRHKLWKQAFLAFSQTSYKTYLDFFLLAHILDETGDAKQAEMTLYHAWFSQWTTRKITVGSEEVLQLYWLLNKLMSEGKLQYFPEDYVRSLRAQLEAKQILDTTTPFQMLMCSEHPLPNT